MGFETVEDVLNQLESAQYIASDEMATVVFLALATQKPVLVEGPAGVGKTQLAKAVALCLNRRLIRLQCYEGLDEAKALYEWEYAKQLLYTQMVKDRINSVIKDAPSLAKAVEKIAAQEDAFFSDRFIQPRPLLKAILSPDPVVLLIDEVDKSDPEFEAFLLELLSDFSVTIPEIGTRKPVTIPLVFLTSNNYRDMSDALKRRCIHLYIDYPPPEREMEIVRTRVPGIEKKLLERLVKVMHRIRDMDLKKKPCISETIDWARALAALEVKDLTPRTVDQTLNLVLKYQSDLILIRQHIAELLTACPGPEPC
ncbi:AAA family ATPase [Desulfospira joergensenii]|uniref:AAA family ATPase n=1 Tax=Desulfospira joergensenii TaxID=53329 RepID=UPI0003B3E652|nr:MoxR family ATPase [Desulfospira joergensenii]